MFETGINIDYINSRIQHFEYGFSFEKTKPPIFNLDTFNFSATEFHKFFVNFPFIFGDLLSPSLAKKWEGVTSLIENTKIASSDNVHFTQIGKLKIFI
jgi:hypothetical protein